LHDVEVGRIEAKSSGRESISHKIHPQQLQQIAKKIVENKNMKVGKKKKESIGGKLVMKRQGNKRQGNKRKSRHQQDTWTGMRASGRPRAAVRKMQTTSPMLDEIR
jgi:hypothetical protein